MARTALVVTVLALAALATAEQGVTKYVRYVHDGQTSYGILEGETVHELRGDLFGARERSGRTVARNAVQFLAPCEPSKVIAVGLNYRSHLGDREPSKYPGLFAKYPTSIVGPEAEIVMTEDAGDLHFEGEMVVVIGVKAKNVSEADAARHVLGVTAGNDVSERAWQRDDLQWFRAKASDTFGPIGPAIVAGLNHNDLALESRLNGEVQQSQRTSDLLFDVEAIVSYVSRYVTLLPGDVIFTGTPGSTRAMKPGDVIEIELEGVGTLRNTIVRR